MAGKNTPCFSDDRSLRFAAAVGMEINHNPIMDPAKLVSPRGV
jgi:hypothetical protein